MRRSLPALGLILASVLVYAAVRTNRVAGPKSSQVGSPPSARGDPTASDVPQLRIPPSDPRTADESKEKRGIEEERKPDGVIEADGEPEPTGNLRVVVLDRGGELSGIEHVSIGYNMGGEGTRVEAHAHPIQGRVLFDVPTEPLVRQVLVVVTPVDRTRPERLFGPFRDWPKDMEIRLVLGEGTALGTIEGTVLDRKEKGAGGVGVRLYASPANGDTRGGLWSSARSDEKGRFRFTRLYPGFYDVSVGTSAIHFGIDQPIRVRTGTKPLRIVVAERAVVPLRIVDTTGRLIPATVHLASTWPDADGKQGKCTEDFYLYKGEGDIRLGTQAAGARHTLIVNRHPPKGIGGHRAIKDWLPTMQEIVLAQTHVLRGRVVDDEGHAIAFGVVRIKDHAVSTTTPLEADGRFAIASIVAGTYDVEVMPLGLQGPANIGGKTSSRVQLPFAGGPITLRLDPLGTIDVSIVGLAKADYEPVFDFEGWPSSPNVSFPVVARLLNERSGNAASRAHTGPHVTFYASDPTATYTYAAYDLPGKRYALRRGLRPGDRIDATVQRGGALRIQPVMADNASYDGTFVIGVALPGHNLEKRVHASKGVCLRGLPPGAWHVTVEDETGRRRGTGHARVGDTTTIVLRPVAKIEESPTPELVIVEDAPMPFYFPRRTPPHEQPSRLRPPAPPMDIPSIFFPDGPRVPIEVTPLESRDR